MLRRAFMTLALLALLSALALLKPAQAAQFSGAYLLHVCGVNPHGLELVPGGHIACQAYIAGVLDYHNLLRSLGVPPSIDFCVPKETSLDDLQKQVFAYVYKNRNQHSAFTAAPAVALALHHFYPCQQRKRSR